MNYRVMLVSRDDTHVYVSDIPESIKKQYQLIKGMSRAKDWPADVVLQFSDNRPEGLVLTDYIHNSLGWIVCSAQFAQLIERYSSGEVELLPVALMNHKGRIASKDYFIANPLRLVEAVDRARSAFIPDASDDRKIFEFSSLVLDPAALASSPCIFRLAERYMTLLARADLADAISKVALSGIAFVEPAMYKQ